MTTSADVSVRARRRTRWRWVAIFLLCLLMGGGFLLRAVLQPERLGALIVAQTAAYTGLRVSTGEPARMGLWPRLHLALVDLDMRRDADTPAMIRAARIDVALPLSILWGGDQTGGRIDVHGPVVDVTEIGAWLDSRLDDGPPVALALPQFATEVHIGNGRLQSDTFAVERIDLSLSPIRVGEIAHVSIAADLGSEPAPQRWQLNLATTPKQDAQGVVLTGLTLDVHAEGDADALASARGEADLFLPQWLRIELEATVARTVFERWVDMSVVPEALVSAPVHVSYQGPSDLSGELNATIEAADARLVMQAHGAALLAWSGDPTASPLPPARVEVEWPSLDYRGIEASGIRLRLQPDAVAPP